MLYLIQPSAPCDTEAIGIPIHNMALGKENLVPPIFLTTYLEALTKQVDEGIPVDVVYLDLAKAFDTVPNQKLLAKIRAHGIDGRIARLIEAWLGYIKQRVIT